MAGLQNELLSPRKQLVLTGTGTGYDGAIKDVGWGPKPISCTIEPIGRQAARLNWSIEFQVAPCDVTDTDLLNHFKAVSYAQSYSNDEEGLLTRVTQGYYEVAPQFSSGKQLSDRFREQLIVQVPPGFRRTGNVWQESADKSRMEFQLVDEQLRGDALPSLISRGEGTWGIGSQGPGFAKAVLNLEAALTVAPGVSPSYSALQFFLMAEQKRKDIRQGYPAANLVPASFSIQRGLWDRART
ncbi:MAG: hypothetical protein ACIALR_09495, partial [Blastopirellula sp. JB062]